MLITDATVVDEVAASRRAVGRVTATGQLVHQSQTWVRLDGGWRVVAAHVSLA